MDLCPALLEVMIGIYGSVFPTLNFCLILGHRLTPEFLGLLGQPQFRWLVIGA